MDIQICFGFRASDLEFPVRNPFRPGSSIYQRHREDIEKIFMLLDGTDRDAYLGRWTKLLASVGTKSRIFAYHIVLIPILVPIEGISEHPAILHSQREFAKYASDLANMNGLEKVEPILLYGRNFAKSIVSASSTREPDAILIGHTKDPGLWNRIRTPLAYRLMNEVDSVLIVHHTPVNDNIS